MVFSVKTPSLTTASPSRRPLRISTLPSEDSPTATIRLSKGYEDRLHVEIGTDEAAAVKPALLLSFVRSYT